jgi:hypothetical protein
MQWLGTMIGRMRSPLDSCRPMAPQAIWIEHRLPDPQSFCLVCKRCTADELDRNRVGTISGILFLWDPTESSGCADHVREHRCCVVQEYSWVVSTPLEKLRLEF